MDILGFIKTLVPHISKNDVLEDIRITKQELEVTTIPIAKQAAEHFKIAKIKSQNAKDLINIFFRNYDLKKQSATVNFASEIHDRLSIVLKNLIFVEKQFEQTTNPDIIAEGITIKKAVMLRSIDQINFISRFTLDFITVVYQDETQELQEQSEETIGVSKAIKDRVDRQIALYGSLLSIYGDEKFDFEKRFDSIPDVILTERTQEAVTSTYGESKLDPIGAPSLAGFIGNPIYHVRLLVAEWQANRYKAMKDKKKMLEMRLLYLQLAQENKSDAKLEQEIAYIQSRIDKIEYSMAKIEKSVES
jgi:hypothetical protein